MTREVRTYGIGNKQFKASCYGGDSSYGPHASWWTFVDEKDIREKFWRIEPGDYALDIGAAYGSYTLAALALGAEKIWAWSPQGFHEPEPHREVELFAESLKLNGWEKKALIFESGVYDQYGILNTVTQELRTNVEELPGPEWIKVQKLDDVVRFLRLPAPGPRFWMKLDVEGAEVHVLKGAERFIANYRPKIMVENHLFKDQDLAKDVRALLESWAYTHVETVPYHSVSHSLYTP